MEIKLTSCSNIHLFKQIHLFLSQNTIPIEITTSPLKENEKEKENQTGGSKKKDIRLAENILHTETNLDPAKLIYKKGYTPYSVISSIFDRILLQKQNDTFHDQQNQTILNSVLHNQKKIITDPTIGLETLSKPIPKTKTILPPEPSSLFVYIKTNHTNPIEAIKGTKLYYLIQRKEQKCAHLV
jgi:hypothetical protein